MFHGTPSHSDLWGNFIIISIYHIIGKYSMVEYSRFSCSWSNASCTGFCGCIFLDCLGYFFNSRNHIGGIFIDGGSIPGPVPGLLLPYPEVGPDVGNGSFKEVSMKFWIVDYWCWGRCKLYLYCLLLHPWGCIWNFHHSWGCVHEICKNNYNGDLTRSWHQQHTTIHQLLEYFFHVNTRQGRWWSEPQEWWKFQIHPQGCSKRQ